MYQMINSFTKKNKEEQNSQQQSCLCSRSVALLIFDLFALSMRRWECAFFHSQNNINNNIEYTLEIYEFMCFYDHLEMAIHTIEQPILGLLLLDRILFFFSFLFTEINKIGNV